MKYTNKYDFEQDFKVINLEMEYEGYKGDIRYAIITDLSEEELEGRYGELISKYKPYVILTREMGAAMTELEQNENKHEMRRLRNNFLFDNTKDFDSVVKLLSVDDALTQKIEELEREQFRKRVRTAFEALTPLQRTYIVRHYLNGETQKEIAADEGKNRAVVCRIIKSGRKRFIKTFEALEGSDHD